ncbi:unnamed protein product [Pieris brassicae]|uniref:Amino acid transporter transmembrane domain-containing protein n=1 Tax=Pieris brassicae TaxID=7116 RepID=A0A9P0TXR1_PIEBR|nr:unnamed protein product [Pieris brassicae]
MALKAEPGGRGNFRNHTKNQAEEDAFDYVKFRNIPKPTGVIGSIAHMVKGALGGGILGGHVAYMKAGVAIAAPFNILFGIYMGYCLYILVMSAQKLYRRTRVPSMSYPDVGEAAMACFPNPKVARFSRFFRYSIDAIICIDLFGACACYQIIIAKSLKQLVENTQRTSIEGINEVFIIFVAIYYAFVYNPSFEGLVPITILYQYFEFVGMQVFSMSCAGVVIPIENNMENPKKYPLVLVIGMFLIICCTFNVSFFGYSAFLENCESPITVNFPMTIGPKILKFLIVIMIYITHALNFWPPFNLCFYYLKQRHPEDQLLKWELIYRACFVMLIGVIAVCFPNINALMGFLGTFCLSNMAFIWPNMIYLLTNWERPGLGKYNWRLWKCIVLISIGCFFLVCGSVVNINELMSVFR